MARVLGAVLVVGFGTMAFAGGMLASPSAEPTVEAFLLDWQQQQYQAAAALTTGDPAEVAAALHGAYQQLDAAAFYLSMGRITQHGASASAGFRAWVDLGQDGAPWQYNGHFSLRRIGSDWRIIWGPSVINPSLRPGYRLAVQSNAQPRQLLQDSSGAPLQFPSKAYEIGVRPDRLANATRTADALGRITGLDPTQLLGWIHAAPGSRFQELVLMGPNQYRRHARALSRVRDLVIRPERVPLFSSIAPAVVGRVDTEASAALRDQGIAYRPGATIGLDGLQLAYQRDLAGTPTTQVVMETSAGRHVTVLAKWVGFQARPVRTTIDGRLQRGAQSAVRQVATTTRASAAVVAVDSATGRILAVAEQKARGMPAIDPLSGRYPPGTAFTIVSAQALLTKLLPVNRPVPCRATVGVGGVTFRNVPPVRKLGVNADFAADFQHACATAFAPLSRLLTARDLNQAATGFGLGANWGLPVPAFSGAVPTSGGVGQVATDMIGQGGVRVSPLAMAMVAARVDSGVWRLPGLVTDPPGTRSSAQPPGVSLSPASLATLRTLMQAAAGASGLPKAAGQTGTAPLAVGKRHVWASWFVGYRGGVAVAVLEISGSPKTSVAPLTAKILSAKL